MTNYTIVIYSKTVYGNELDGKNSNKIMISYKYSDDDYLILLLKEHSSFYMT